MKPTVRAIFNQRCIPIDKRWHVLRNSLAAAGFMGLQLTCYSPASADDAGLQVAESAQIELRDPESIASEPIEIRAAEAPDAELAKRPWLLEKLVGKETEPSVKMDPPEPAADPPSIRKITPPTQRTQISSQTVSDGIVGDDWVARRKTNVTSRRIAPVDRPLVEVTIEEVQPSDRTPKRIPTKIADIDSEANSPSATVGDLPGDSEPSENAIADSSAVGASPELDYTGFPKQPIRLTRNVYRMRNRMQQTLRSYYTDIEVANQRSNWGMMHAIMVYGIDTKVRVGRRTYSTIAWIAGNNACRGQKLLEDRDGDLFIKSGVGLQGHQAQMLAVFSLCDVPEDYPLYADQGEYSVADVIEIEKLDCKSGEELTFTLIGLSHYLDTDAVWTNREGEVWTFERLIQEELGQPIVGAACGGTHRLMGFAHALRKRRAEGKPITGQWKRAEDFTKDFVQYAYRLQNRDGSFSTDWFEGRENNGKIDRQIQTTGHIVEWLLTVTPDSQLQNPRLVSAINFLLKSMYEERKHDWSIGPKGHALRSLAMYYDRVYQAPPPWRSTPQSQVARKRTSGRR